MSDLEKSEQTDDKQDDQHLIAEPGDQGENQLRPFGLRERVRKLLSGVQQRRPRTKQESARDRTRALTLLIGGTVGSVLLFMGLFSTPTISRIDQTGSRAVPNLGRTTAPDTPIVTQSSVTPLLNADVRSDEGNSDQLSPADIQNTSRRATAEEVTNTQETRMDFRVSRVSIPPAQNLEASVGSSTSASDPRVAYRPNNNAGTRTYGYGGQPASTTAVAETRTFDYGVAASTPAENRPAASPTVKSSIVFVRSTDATEGAGRSRQGVTTSFEQPLLLPPGTRLIARLEAAATTAVKTPVVGSIEYNYERDGVIIVPAGTRVLGDVQQASAEGYLNVRFHTMLRPDGREDAIEGVGMTLDHKPLKGEVSGKNTGKKFLSRTLSGVGTIAAYVVGAGGAGLSRTVTGETLLRDRLASNIALAGEQELMNAAYSQNISVTVPGNTRFYVVIQKAAMNGVTAPPVRRPEAVAQPMEIPSVQELRELMDLRREINRMYLESNGKVPGRSN